MNQLLRTLVHYVVIDSNTRHKFTIRPDFEYCGHLLAGALVAYLETLDKIRRIRNMIDPEQTSRLQSLS